MLSQIYIYISRRVRFRPLSCGNQNVSDTCIWDYFTLQTGFSTCSPSVFFEHSNPGNLETASGRHKSTRDFWNPLFQVSPSLINHPCVNLDFSKGLVHWGAVPVSHFVNTKAVAKTKLFCKWAFLTSHERLSLDQPSSGCNSQKRVIRSKWVFVTMAHRTPSVKFLKTLKSTKKRKTNQTNNPRISANKARLPEASVASTSL